MSKIGIFFGTDTGSTRLIAKMIAKKLGDDIASKPLNVNRINVEDMLSYDALILGTPTYGEGQVPGKSTKVAAGSWEEFLPQIKTNDLSGKVIAIYGLGDQEKYSERFADGLFQLYSQLQQCGANIIGDWSTEGYEFEKSKSVVDGKFVGLVLDQSNQRLLTEERIDAWLKTIVPILLKQETKQAVA
ncbi:MAG: flavodoxin [Gammaproteobacteria bacterium SG8_11]|nr:MAG: flavodoxin [Gammaproteobacteria bacterium SG8_11]